MNQFFTIIIFSLFCVQITAQNEAVDWNKDLEYLKKELPKKHVNLFFRLAEEDFNREIDKLIDRASYMNNYQVLVNLSKILAKIGDSHTYVNYRNFVTINDLFPFSLYWFNDGLFVVHARSSVSALLGQQLVAVNDYPITQIVDSIATLVAIDNSSAQKSTLPRMVGFIPFLEYFGFMNGDKIEITTINSTGIKSTIAFLRSELKREQVFNYQPESVSFCWINRGQFFVSHFFENDKILYVQYNKCWSKELELIMGSKERAENLPSFVAFQKNLFDQIDTLPVEKLVFDLRFNNGGASPQGTKLVKKVAGIEELNQKGKLFVITGINTFSSGLINVLDFKEQTNAIFVGSITGGKPNHYGEINQLKLPTSGTTINYSTKYFDNNMPGKNSFYPDVEINTSFYYYNKGIDPVYEYIRDYKQ